MKKVLIKILVCALALSMVVTGLVGCKKDKWDGTSMTAWGKVDASTNGGFVAETEEYIYYINGIADSTADNTFGTPVKGALMAADKDDLTKTEVVVPKLFAATDYKSGLFLNGDYVYYGTPNVEKDGSGNVANTELTFMRTKLDGTETEEFFTVSSLATEYRFIAANDTVYIVYYDTAETALYCVDTVNDEKLCIAKTDATTEKNRSMASYNFLPVEATDGGLAVLYTVSIYSEEYIESKAEQQGYSRATEKYNEIYMYTVGEDLTVDLGLAGKKVLGNDKSTFAITLVDSTDIYYTETLENGTVNTYGIKAADLKDGKDATKIENSSYVADGNLIDLASDTVYTLTEGKVHKSTLKGNDKADKKLVANNSNITTMLFVEGEELFYVNASTQIAKIKLGEVDAKEIRVSGDTVSTAWFAAEIACGKLFYLDSSALGASYVHYVSLDAKVDGDDTDNDGEIDAAYHLVDATFIGKMVESDLVTIANTKITNIANNLESGTLKFEEVDGKLVAKDVSDARTAYNALSEESKKEFSEETLATLENYEKAVEMANLYAKLDGMYGYVNLSEDDRKALKTAYDEVKASIVEFRKSENYSTISAYIANNLKANYDLAVAEFESK